jgi:CRP/FNR family cyclic AMP-dependent transcriptional regulator
MKLLEMFRDWEDTEVYRARKVIFSERSPADVMYIVLSGEVELTLYDEPLGIEGEGGMIGEMAMIGATNTRSATATTLTKVKLARLNRDQFRVLVSENTGFALHVMAKLANRLRVANNYISRQFAQFR